MSNISPNIGLDSGSSGGGGGDSSGDAYTTSTSDGRSGYPDNDFGTFNTDLDDELMKAGLLSAPYFSESVYLTGLKEWFENETSLWSVVSFSRTSASESELKLKPENSKLADWTVKLYTLSSENGELHAEFDCPDGVLRSTENATMEGLWNHNHPYYAIAVHHEAFSIVQVESSSPHQAVQVGRIVQFGDPDNTDTSNHWGLGVLGGYPNIHDGSVTNPVWCTDTRGDHNMLIEPDNWWQDGELAPSNYEWEVQHSESSELAPIAITGRTTSYTNAYFRYAFAANTSAPPWSFTNDMLYLYPSDNSNYGVIPFNKNVSFN